MTLVATAGIGVLVALPGWLRDLEAVPPQGFAQKAEPPRIIEAAAEMDSAAVTDTAAVIDTFAGIDTAAVFDTDGAVDTSSVVPSSVAVAKPEQPQREVRHRELRYRVLADFLAKRYRVSRDTLERFVRIAYAAGHSTQVDPLLILAVMAVESSFNPIAESVVGAKGLMQIMPQYHQDKLRLPHGGPANVLDPEINIIAGAKVLREYATKTGEDIVAALRLYGGVASDLENPYPTRVLSERERLEEFLRKVSHVAGA